VKETLLAIEKLPSIETHSKWIQELERCKTTVDNCIDIRRDHPEIHQLMTKIYDERRYWGKCNQTRERTLKLNAYARNDHIKNWLFEAILQPNSGVSV
jgi:hypothetical protein